MMKSEGFQDLGVGCIRNDAVLLFYVEKHKTGIAIFFFFKYIRSLITCSGGWELFRKTPLVAIYLVLVISLWDLVSETPVGSSEFYPGLNHRAFLTRQKNTFFYEFKGLGSCSNTINWDQTLCESLYKQNQYFCLYVLLGHKGRKPDTPVQGRELYTLK